MVRQPYQQRCTQAASDERSVYMGVRWVSDHFHISGTSAKQVVTIARRRAGPAKCAEMDRAARLADLAAALQSAEGKWPGALTTMLVEPHRRVAERYAVDRGSVWWVLCRLRELSELTGQTMEATVRAVLRDLRTVSVR